MYLPVKSLVDLLLFVVRDVLGIQLVEAVPDPGVLLEERPPDGLRGVRGEDEVDGLVLERLEHLLLGLAEVDEALDGLVDVGLGGGGALVGEVPALELVPAAVGDLQLLGEVGEVEHVLDGARDEDGVGGGQRREPGPELLELRGVALALVLRRQLVALLDLQQRRSIRRRTWIESKDDRSMVNYVRIRGWRGRGGSRGCQGSGP